MMEKESLKIEAGKPKKIGKIGAGLIPVIGLIVVAVIGLEVPKIPIRATETAEAKHTQASITQTFVAPTQTLEPTLTSTHTPTPSLTPTEDLPTETKVLLTPTDYIYDQSISIGYIGHSDEDNSMIRRILTDLEFTVGKIWLDSYAENDIYNVESELLKYDVIYFPSGWSKFNYEITDFRTAFLNYISSGHGVFVQEANSISELTTTFLPFDIKFSLADPVEQSAEILDFNHYIFGNLNNSEFSFRSRDYLSNYDHFTVLANGENSNEPLLLISQYHLGRILIFIPDITLLDVNNQNDILIKNMFYWLNGEVD